MKTPNQYAGQVLQDELKCPYGALWLALHGILAAAFSTALAPTPTAYLTALEEWARGYAERHP